MSDVVIFDPNDVTVPNRVTAYVRSVHTPNWENNPNALINPSMSAVDGVCQKYWKVDSGSLMPMTTLEQNSLDVATCQGEIQQLKYVYKEEFIGRNYDKLHWKVATNGGKGKIFVLPDTEGGVLCIRSGKTDGRWTSSDFCGYNQFSASRNAVMTVLCKLEDIDRTYIEIGLHKAETCIRFHKNGSGNWYAKTQDTSATETDTGVAPASGWNRFDICASAASIEFFVNRVLVGTITTDIPQICLSPYVYQKTISGSTTCDLLVDYIELSGDRIL